MLASFKRRINKASEAENKQKEKLQLILNQSNIAEVKAKQAINKTHSSEPLSLNVIADQVARKTLDIANKLSLECQCEIKNVFKKGIIEASIHISLIEQLSNFSFEKYSEYLHEQASELINSPQFILDTKKISNENLIVISIIKV